MKLINNFKFGRIVLVLLFFSTQVASAQEVPVWDKPELRDSVITLLSKYQDLHNKINSQTAPQVIRDFIHLFPNSKVQVVNEIEVQGKPPEISIEDLIAGLTDRFPEGLAVSLDLDRLTMDRPKYDRNSRYMIRVRMNHSLYGVSGGQVCSSSQSIVFQIGFYYNNNTPDGFAIYGTSLPSNGQSHITVSFSPALTGFVNSVLGSDQRWIQKPGTGFTGGIFFSYYFSDHLGIGSGMQFTQYSGSISLNQFDAFGGFNPNLRDILIDNDLWFVEVPVFLSCRTNPANRWQFSADLGILSGIRVFENVVSSAVNTNSGVTLVNVISDPEWISRMNRFVFGIQGGISLRYSINNQLGILFGGGMRQGLSALDHNVQAGFISSKYLGQYNPLWGAPGKTVNQAFFINMGATIFLHKEEN